MVIVVVVALVLPVVIMVVRSRVSPQHELLDDEEDAEAQHESNADPVCPCGPDARHRFRQQGEQPGAPLQQGLRGTRVGGRGGRSRIVAATVG